MLTRFFVTKNFNMQAEKLLAKLTVKIIMDDNTEIKDWVSERTTPELDALIQACLALETKQQNHSGVMVNPEAIRKAHEIINKEIRKRQKTVKSKNQKWWKFWK